MAEFWIVYRDVEGFPRKRIEQMATPGPGTMLIKDQTFPAGAGFKAMHIKTHHLEIGSDRIHLVTYTEEPLTIVAAAELATNWRRGQTEPPPPEEEP